MKSYFANDDDMQEYLNPEEGQETELPNLAIEGLAKQDTVGGFLSLEEILFTKVFQMSGGSPEPLKTFFADIGWRICRAEDEYARMNQSRNPEHSREYDLLLKHFTR